jgi:hypothetical protein
VVQRGRRWYREGGWFNGTHEKYACEKVKADHPIFSGRSLLHVILGRSRLQFVQGEGWVSSVRKEKGRGGMKREVGERHLKRTPTQRSRPTPHHLRTKYPRRHLATEDTAARVRRGLGEQSEEREGSRRENR